MKTVNIHKAKTDLSKLIQEVLNGEEVIIAKYGEPLVKMEPYKPLMKRKAGAWKGKVIMTPDFDELPAELMAAFKGEKE